MKSTSLLKFLLAPILLCSPSIFSAAQENATSTKPSRNDSGGQSDLDELVDVGDHRLHVKCIGSGGATVIMEAGLGDSSRTWDKVMPEVSKFTRVCVYDRPGEGKSDRAPRTLRRFGARTYIELRTGGEIVQDLHVLLAKAGELGPYVLVGHSFGGLCAILYAHQYPGDVVGMVLVDSSHEDQVGRDKALITPEHAKRRHNGLMQNEEGVDMDQVLAQVRAAHWRTNIPLYVLARGRVDPYPADWSAETIARREQAWREMQEDHARRSSNGKLVVAEKSGHDIQDEQPELVIDAVRQVITLTRDKAGQAQTH
jgi:pimeloyl-ACP methyl ester carboxylesterase